MQDWWQRFDKQAIYPIIYCTVHTKFHHALTELCSNFAVTEIWLCLTGQPSDESMDRWLRSWLKSLPYNVNMVTEREKNISSKADWFALPYINKTTYSGTGPNTKQCELVETKNINSCKHSDFDEV